MAVKKANRTSYNEATPWNHSKPIMKSGAIAGDESEAADITRAAGKHFPRPKAGADGGSGRARAEAAGPAYGPGSKMVHNKVSGPTGSADNDMPHHSRRQSVHPRPMPADRTESASPTYGNSTMIHQPFSGDGNQMSSELGVKPLKWHKRGYKSMGQGHGAPGNE
jgi:hypothetical protein